jgi:DNA-binding NtrC family response regulator
MSREQPKILIVDDEPEFCRFVEDCLASDGYDFTSANDGEAALGRVDEGIDAVLCDFKMPGMSGMELIERIHAMDADIPVIMVTAFGSIDHAVEAMRAGAYDYVTKPVSIADLRLHVGRATETRRLRNEVTRLREAAAQRFSLDGVIARAARMRKVVETVKQLETSTSNVLVTGESGTGKEVIARAIHAHSPVASGPFVPVNCAAIPEQLLESELFGHERGAFTDARGPKLGLFHMANGGTLFLDEIGEMSFGLQAKLLRVLEDGEVRRVGATKSEPLRVRVISATNRSLEQQLDDGFRADLYYRLNVVEIRIPPLRERREDIPALIDDALQTLASNGRPRTLTEAARRLLTDYEWPGNVRQLQNALEHAVALSAGEVIDVEDVPESIRNPTTAAMSRAVPFSTAFRPELSLKEIDELYIDRVLQHTRGNRSAAAALLGIDRKTLYQRLKKRRR